MAEEGNGKHITASDHIKMNYELVRKKYTHEFKLLSLEHHQTNSKLLTLQFKRGNCKWISRTQEIHTTK